MSRLKSILFFLLLVVMMMSCGVSKKGKGLFVDDTYIPIYRDNGGAVKTNILNKKAVQREKEFIALMKLVDKSRPNNPDIPKDPTGDVEDVIAKAIKKTNKQIDDLMERIKKIKVTDSDSHEQVLVLLKELNDLNCKKIGAINRFLKKKVVKLYGDVSFQTGSAIVSPRGLVSLDQFTDQVVKDINEWRYYVNDCNQKVFENDLFILVVDISGYADQQGQSASNQTLSENRASSVKRELIQKLNNLISEKNIKIVFNKINARGFGETLPPGVKQAGEDDPNRRICLISSVVGPSALLGE